MPTLTEKDQLKLSLDSDIKRLLKQKEAIEVHLADLSKKTTEETKKYIKAKEDAEKVTLDLNKREKTLIDIKQNLDNFERDLKDKERQLALRQDKMNALRNQLNSDISIHTEKFKIMDRQEKELNIRVDAINKLEIDLANKQEELDIRTTALDQRVAEVKEREEVADSRERHIQQKLAKINDDLDRIEKERASLGAYKNRLDGDYVEKENKLKEQYEKKDKIIAAEKDALKKRELALIDEEKKIEAEKASIQARKDELKILESRKR